MKKWTLLSFYFIISLITWAQKQDSKDVMVDGFVFLKGTTDPISSASVIVRRPNDSIFIKGTITKNNGSFSFSLNRGEYIIECSFVGYEKKYLTREVLKSMTLDTIFLNESDAFTEVHISAKMPPVNVKGDTIEFNSSAYHIDGSTKLKDFVKQIPGLQFDINGGMKYGGKPINKILLDGKEYFGNDIQMALNNLPANMISKLQLFNKESEESKASGIKDIEPDQVLNVSVKEDYKKSIFGDTKLGLGSKDRYTVGLNLNKLHGDNQFALNSTFNNMNDSEYRNYADFDDNVLKNVGANVNLQSSEKITWNSSIDYSDYKTNDSYRSDSYTSILKQYSNREGEGTNKQRNIFLSSNLKINPDSLTYISLTTNIGYSDGNGINLSLDSATIVDKSRTVSRTSSQSNNSGINFNNQLTVSRKTSKGRSLTLTFGQQYDDSETLGKNFSEKVYYDVMKRDTLDQRSKTTNNTQGFNLSARYVEPLSKKDKLYLSYYYSYQQSEREGDTRRLDPNTKDYTIIDTAYSRNTYSKILKHDFRVGYQRVGEKGSLNLNFTVSPSDMRNKTVLVDSVLDLKQKVVNYSPSVRLNWKPSESSSLGLSYIGSSRYPSLTQLSADTVVISTMRKTIGNPDLRISFTHRGGLDFYVSDFDSGRSFNINLTYSQTKNAVVNSTFVDDHSNTISTYTNSNGISNGSVYSNFTTPLKNRNITIGFNANGSVSRNINFINSQKNVLKNSSFSFGGVLLVYSGVVESNLNISSSFNFSHNNLADISFSRTINTSLSNTTRFNIKWDFRLESIFNFSWREGYGTDVRKTETLWNLAISKLILKDKRGEVKLEVYDVLNNYRTQENKVSGSDYSNYWRKVVNNYFVASFTYRFDLRNQ